MNVKNHPIVDAFYTPREQQLGQEHFFNTTRRIMADISKAQKESLCTMPIFTFLRDPVDRFISSVGQALKLNKLHPCSTKSKDTPELLKCVVDKIKRKGLFLDEHLVPQSFELYYGVMGYDIAIRVLDLSSIGQVLKKLGFSSDHSSGRRRKGQGLVAGFNLSTSLLSPSILNEICSLYDVDVRLLHQTGVTKTRCDRNVGR